MPSPNYAPDRIETGTQSHEAIAGAAAAVNFLASLTPGGSRRERLLASIDSLHHRSMNLFTQLWNGLSALDGVTTYGPSPDGARTSTIAFTVKDISSADVCRHLAERGVFASDGDFYATTVVEKMGKAEQGLVRAGCACYTTSDEIERLINGVRELV